MPTCAEVSATFIRESSRILPVFRTRGRVRSWWASIGAKGHGIPSEPWEYEMGDTLSRQILERTTPSTAFTWTTIAANPADTLSDGSTCNPTSVIVKNASTSRTTQLSQGAMSTDWVCVNDIRSSLNFKRQMAHMLSNLSDNVTDEWEKRNRSQYVGYAKHKVVMALGFPDNTSGTDMDDFPLTVPTSSITQKYLNRLRTKLQHNAAGTDGGAYARQDGGDVFAVIMSTDMQEALFTSSDRINQDRRYAEAPKILRAYGVERSYQGWFHIIDDKAPRFDFVNGAWIERPFYANSATTRGNRADVNPDYEAAAYELVIPFLPTVMTRMIPRTFTTAGSGTSFLPWNYAGTPRWRNHYDITCNPFETNGYWQLLMQAAYMPEKIEDGYAIMAKRPCADASTLEMTTCSVTS